MLKPQRCFNGIRLLDGVGPSLRNISRVDYGAIPMIIRMMRIGMRIDLSHFEKMEKSLVQDMESITEDVKTLTGHYCNLDSGDQVADLLFSKLGLKQARPKMTSSGERESVEDEVLTAIQHDHPVVPKILTYKEYSKLLGTYVRPMPKLAKRTAFGEWRMYPQIGTTRVPSGRLNCKNPNLLAMPTRTDRGQEIRKGFIADPGWVYVSVDLSQIEVRIAAHSSQDPALMAVYEKEEDIYSDFAISAFKLKDERYQDETGKWIYPTVHKMDNRYPAKTCILASLYDVSAPGLLEQLPIICKNCKKEATKHDCSKFESYWTENMAQDLINAFYLKYPGVMSDRKRAHRQALKYGFTWDMWGRILHVQAVRSVHPWVVSAALREVGNFNYQSSSQGVIKISMAQIDTEFEDNHVYDLVQPHLQIHDELLMTARADVVEDVGQHIKDVFEHCVKLRIPLKASASTADSWGKISK